MEKDRGGSRRILECSATDDDGVDVDWEIAICLRVFKLNMLCILAYIIHFQMTSWMVCFLWEFLVTDYNEIR